MRIHCTKIHTKPTEEMQPFSCFFALYIKRNWFVLNPNQPNQTNHLFAIKKHILNPSVTHSHSKSVTQLISLSVNP